MADFINGLALNHLFYEEVVAPILKSHFPDIKYHLNFSYLPIPFGFMAMPDSYSSCC